MIILVTLVFPANVGPLPISRRTLDYIDYFGMVLSLAGSVLLIFALEEGGGTYEWGSATIIVTFAIAGLSLVGFAMWEWTISRNILRTSMLPIFPAKLITKRVIGSAIM